MATSRGGWARFTITTLTWKAPWQCYLVTTVVRWRGAFVPRYAAHKDKIRKVLAMPDVDPALLVPTRLRMSISLYDPTLQRYRYMKNAGRNVIIETADEYQALLARLDAALAQLEANHY
jgi:hypothetical protein